MLWSLQQYLLGLENGNGIFLITYDTPGVSDVNLLQSVNLFWTQIFDNGFIVIVTMIVWNFSSGN